MTIYPFDPKNRWIGFQPVSEDGLPARRSNSFTRSRMAAGFTLPAVIIVAAALLILAIGILIVTGIERSTARSFVDRQRAELAARAGLEEIRDLLAKETANDDFIVLQSVLEDDTKQAAPHLFIARGETNGGEVDFRFIPLFSAYSPPPEDPSGLLKAPDLAPMLDHGANSPAEFTTLRHLDPLRLAWENVKDGKNRTVARYAYWVEDLQSRIDATTAGNTKGGEGAHLRTAYPFPAPGMNSEELSKEEPKLNQIALHVLDPESGDVPVGTLTKDMVEGRKAMLSPDAALGAAGFSAPQPRDDKGMLVSPIAAAVETNVSTVIQPYQERPLIPFANGIAPALSGKPKLNLNALLEQPRDSAITDFANQIKSALPRFGERNPAFPEDYHETLAAAALDYADDDQDITVSPGRYRGLESAPLLSEIYLQVNYNGTTKRNGRRILNFRFIVCAELWNMSNQTAEGSARISYEVDLRPTTGFGASADAFPFDDPDLLDDPTQASHSLSKEGGRYWTPAQTITLGPNQYRFLRFADVVYTIDAGSQSSAIGEAFDLFENEGSRGMSLQWNGLTADRIERIKRLDTGGAGNRRQWNFKMDETKTVSKAGIPGHTYRSVGKYWNNMGDPRISYYIRSIPLDENASPENLSPNRRNVRISSIYNSSTGPTRFYGRVLPSEWPDGGHNSMVGTWPVTKTESVLPTDARYNYNSTDESTAPLRISNAGRFYSPTELGHIHDPLMWRFAYPKNSDTSTILGGNFPIGQLYFPDVIQLSTPDANYGGGNTLRIGRGEHPRFDVPGLRATHLLDLFHAGDSTSADAAIREGPLVTMQGHINLNTAGRDAIRALAAGVLLQDRRISRMLSRSHRGAPFMSPSVRPIFGDFGTPTASLAADKVADAIIKSRPFSSWAEVSSASRNPQTSPDLNNRDPEQVFGNRAIYPEGDNLQWTDAAAEETFARVFEGSTLRSRNFRIWVVAQAVSPLAPDSKAKPEVLAEVRRSFTVFADPGERDDNSDIKSESYKIRTTHENDF